MESILSYQLLSPEYLQNVGEITGLHYNSNGNFDKSVA
jgi:hypothetical protein